MEINHYISSWLFTLILALAPLFLLLKLKQKCVSTKHKLPPGQMGIPWLGETMDFYRAQQANRLFEDFVQPRMGRHGKIFKTRLMGSPTVIVSGAEANRFFLSSEFKLVISSWPSSSVQLMGKNSIMQKHGEQHRHIHGLVASSLGSASAGSLVPKLSKLVQRHLDAHWSGQERINLYHFTKNLTFHIVFECLLGIDVEPGMPEIFERILEGVFMPAVNVPGTKFSRAMRARKEIESLFVRVVRKKKEELERENSVGGGGGNKEGEAVLLPRYVAAMLRGEMSEEEVIDNMVLMVFGAQDTTSFAIAMTFRMLAQHPHCYQLLLKEHMDFKSRKRGGEDINGEDIKKMSYTWKVARETLRLFPPIFGSFREAIVDIDYEGFTIPKGWKVLWTTYGTHLDPEHFPDPTRFDPDRFDEAMPPYVYMPFGGGPRVCAGSQLARMNILVLLHHVATRYDWSLIHPDEPVTSNPLPYPVHGMPIRISPKRRSID
ncbi:taxadiene 5-alpha hydroxylase [Eucalyptus grandis]|uniref:taxadiene 5-alpha hydroxylase n=1 Tax=Eucalyptus grandis TaxID=71139 RepID=UPI00192EE1C3|nr:taxadiene 5-alpha hydroxylase [Eucalyptus grandis]